MARRLASCLALILLPCSWTFAQGLSPSTPAQEYIRLNGQVIAIENAPVANLPFGAIDVPGAGNNNAALTGTVTLSGWALSNVAAINHVAISVDGQLLGNAVYGNNRPDVCQADPNGVGCPASPLA